VNLFLIFIISRGNVPRVGIQKKFVGPSFSLIERLMLSLVIIDRNLVFGKLGRAFGLLPLVNFSCCLISHVHYEHFSLPRFVVGELLFSMERLSSRISQE
jgi:phosphoribosyl 1,2-cyclic phosphodiesterase